MHDEAHRFMTNVALGKWKGKPRIEWLRCVSMPTPLYTKEEVVRGIDCVAIIKNAYESLRGDKQ